MCVDWITEVAGQSPKPQTLIRDRLDSRRDPKVSLAQRSGLTAMARDFQDLTVSPDG